MITLYFKGTGRFEENEIKSAVFLTWDRKPVRLFREITNLEIKEDGTFQMIWKRCYIIDNGGNKIYLEHENSAQFSSLRFVGVQTEKKSKITVAKVNTDVSVLYLAA